jgi:nucleoside-diphosphate-sugar epimerase
VEAVVTGAAGFIGSHLAERLVARGDRVVGIDCLTNYYDTAAKLENLSSLRSKTNFTLVTDDLCTADLRRLLAGAEVVFHEAAQPGVRGSWSDGFAEYCSNNVLATQRVLEAALAADVPRVVYASSSSVYGNATEYPVRESHLPHPASPYGVTKLAAEHLCSLYATNYGLATVSLRYFTVYGPRQRPDMAFRRLVDTAIAGGLFPLYGSGHQVRDFTYVGDVVDANLLAASCDVPPGSVINIAGGTRAELLEVIDMIGALVGRRVSVEQLPWQPGDVERTEGCIDSAADLLAWRPRTTMAKGLAAMVEWARWQS